MHELAFVAVAPLHVRRSALTRYVSIRKHTNARCRAPMQMALTAPAAPVETAVCTTLRRWYRLVPPSLDAVRAAQNVFGLQAGVKEEVCFVVELERPLTADEEDVLVWLFAETFEPQSLRDESSLKSAKMSDEYVTSEIGPRLSFQTAWGSNAVCVVRACGVQVVRRIERFRIYRLLNVESTVEGMRRFEMSVHDRMTEAVYEQPVTKLETLTKIPSTLDVDVMGRGEDALREINESLGLGFDEQDITYYLALFKDDLKRNPTDVELFDLAQSNSEHSRHWYFNARLVHDGVEVKHSLMDVVRAPLKAYEDHHNSVLAFADNSSSIRGGEAQVLRPAKPGEPSAMIPMMSDVDVLCTAETHNFPSGVAPFPGAETGTGGRIRDSAATGTGSLVGVGIAGYSVGNLNIPGYQQPWEHKEQYPSNLASPLRILIEASNGASDYGNKFGEPVIAGFARTYGFRHPDGERREYVKPIMFSAGVGLMDHAHAIKGSTEVGLVVVKIGGPAYRIGVGGGAASSMTQGTNRDDLDFNAVQRGDAQMEQKAYRVIRACVELGPRNPIVSIHDQGAGGNCNVVKELIFPQGATIQLRDIWIADRSLSALEIWGAEYQEQFGLLLNPADAPLFESICRREGTVATEIGRIDGSGRLVLWDSVQSRSVADMDLEKVLGKLPRKTFVDTRASIRKIPTVIPYNDNLRTVLGRVLTLMGVGSKRFLTTKVDRSVTGLVALQQTVGKLQLPLADAAMVATSHFGRNGAVTALGERPTITTLAPDAMARMSVAEMMTNLCCVKVTSRQDIKCEANWMWAAKTAGDGAAMYDAAIAMRDVMIALGIAVDGGKDSLSMAARCPTDDGGTEEVRAPGTLVITGYCTVPDVNAKLTPDIKHPGESLLLHIDVANGKRRLGGSALGQVFSQLGDIPPDIDDAQVLRNAFDVLQQLHQEEAVYSYHDISDGGVLVTALEMVFAGDCGLELNIDSGAAGVSQYAALFAEEAGVVLEVATDVADSVLNSIRNAGVTCTVLGKTSSAREVVIVDGDEEVLRAGVSELRGIWERTAFELERLQADKECVNEEEEGFTNGSRQGLSYFLPYVPRLTPTAIMNATRKPRVAVIRAEGSNGDREMAAAFHLAGFDAWDVSMSDIMSGTASLESFRGIAFVGGFSYADVLDSAKGWAGVARFCEPVRRELTNFFRRSDTFSLGVCNGCQLMALLGTVPGEVETVKQPRFVRNRSQRYESRFVTVTVQPSPAIMLQGMEGARLGVWVAHGEGRAYFPDENVEQVVFEQSLAPIRYVDDQGEVTNVYPFNPNGSVQGVAALCSPDGRHLAMMPHPERAILPWQWAYGGDFGGGANVTGWLRMFQNAREWCEDKSKDS